MLTQIDLGTVNARIPNIYRFLNDLNDGVQEIAPLVYNGGFNLGTLLRETLGVFIIDYPLLIEGETQRCAYGVADNVDQVLELFKAQIDNPDIAYVLNATPVKRNLANKGRGGGWRWHKWGPYIGVKTPTTEYLDDEPEIDEVIVYHIYELG